MKKKLIFVNNNMNIGGVQKSLVSLLKAIEGEYDITLLLFSDKGEYIDEIPESVNVITCDSLFKCLGISQKESEKNILLFLCRGVLAFITKIFGRKYAMRIILHSQKKIEEYFDCAISFLQNGGNHSFYGGCNEFVLEKIEANRKIAFLHCDYRSCGANTEYNNKIYKKFDKIAACSEGCKNAFIEVLPFLASRIDTVINCHDFKRIQELSMQNDLRFNKETMNIVSVARLSSEKGIERAVKAVKYVIEKGIRVNYYIVGDGILRSQIEEQIQKYKLTKEVFLCGNQKNPYGFIKNADILLIPSYHEAAPLVIDEARCLGIPILATETTSTQDMVVERKIGWVCGNNQDELENMLYQIVSNRELLIKCKNQILLQKCNNNVAVNEFRNLLG